MVSIGTTSILVGCGLDEGVAELEGSLEASSRCEVGHFTIQGQQCRIASQEVILLCRCYWPMYDARTDVASLSILCSFRKRPIAALNRSGSSMKRKWMNDGQFLVLSGGNR